MPLPGTNRDVNVQLPWNKEWINVKGRYDAECQIVEDMTIWFNGVEVTPILSQLVQEQILLDVLDRLEESE